VGIEPKVLTRSGTVPWSRLVSHRAHSCQVSFWPYDQQVIRSGDCFKASFNIDCYWNMCSEAWLQRLLGKQTLCVTSWRWNILTLLQLNPLHPLHALMFRFRVLSVQRVILQPGNTFWRSISRTSAKQHHSPSTSISESSQTLKYPKWRGFGPNKWIYLPNRQRSQSTHHWSYQKTTAHKLLQQGELIFC